jgi:hypothetical protein
MSFPVVVFTSSPSRWLLYFFLVRAVVGNVIEAGADLYLAGDPQKQEDS